jgi:Outer membrane protein beta-barrel domain
MRKALLAAAAAALIFAGSSAHAADGLYVGAGVGKSNLHDLFGSGFSLDSNRASWKVIAGFRPIDWFSVEANYMDFGSDSRNFGLGTASANAKAFGAYGVAYLPIPFFDVFAKAGLARWQLDGNIAGGGQIFAFNDRGTEFAYGGGSQVNFGPFAARFEYDAFGVRHTDGLGMYSVSAIWTFL